MQQLGQAGEEVGPGHHHHGRPHRPAEGRPPAGHRAQAGVQRPGRPGRRRQQRDQAEQQQHVVVDDLAEAGGHRHQGQGGQPGQGQGDAGQQPDGGQHGRAEGERLEDGHGLGRGHPVEQAQERDRPEQRRRLGGQLRVGAAGQPGRQQRAQPDPDRGQPPRVARREQPPLDPPPGRPAAAIGAPGAAGEAEGPVRRRPPVPGPPRHVGDGLVDADLGDLAAPVADGRRPGLADGRLPLGRQAGEALEDLDVPAVAGRQVGGTGSASPGPPGRRSPPGSPAAWPGGRRRTAASRSAARPPAPPPRRPRRRPGRPRRTSAPTGAPVGRARRWRIAPCRARYRGAAMHRENHLGGARTPSPSPGATSSGRAVRRPAVVKASRSAQTEPASWPGGRERRATRSGSDGRGTTRRRRRRCRPGPRRPGGRPPGPRRSPAAAVLGAP